MINVYIYNIYKFVCFPRAKKKVFVKKRDYLILVAQRWLLILIIEEEAYD